MFCFVSNIGENKTTGLFVKLIQQGIIVQEFVLCLLITMLERRIHPTGLFCDHFGVCFRWSQQS